MHESIMSTGTIIVINPQRMHKGYSSQSCLYYFIGIICDSFERAGFPSLGGSRTFAAHLTVVKIPWRVDQTIPAHAYSQLREQEFGEQKVEALELCSMSKSSGYYPCLTRCPLN